MLWGKQHGLLTAHVPACLPSCPAYSPCLLFTMCLLPYHCSLIQSQCSLLCVCLLVGFVILPYNCLPPYLTTCPFCLAPVWRNMVVVFWRVGRADRTVAWGDIWRTLSHPCLPSVSPTQHVPKTLPVIPPPPFPPSFYYPSLSPSCTMPTHLPSCGLMEV